MSSNDIEYFNLREEPPAGSGKIKPIKCINRLTNIRDWLIMKLAGDRMVILNARIRTMPREKDTNIVGKVSYSKGGSMINDCDLLCDDEVMLQITNTTELRK